MHTPASLPPPDTPTVNLKATDARTAFVTKTELTNAQIAAFHRLWDIIANESDGSSMEEIHEEQSAAA